MVPAGTRSLALRACLRPIALFFGPRAGRLISPACYDERRIASSGSSLQAWLRKGHVPVEAKPIFRPDVIRLPVLGFSLPESVVKRRPKLQKWAEIIATGSVDAHKEQEILGDFLNDVFCELLGYTRAVDNPKRYTFSREKHVQTDGKFVDAVLGEFGSDGNRNIAAVEGKGPKDPLDRPFAGRKVSAVDQAFDYAINLRCNWILVTNIRQTRLYYKGTDKQTYERFDTETLAADERQLRKFVFLLHANRVVPLSRSVPSRHAVSGVGESRPRADPGGLRRVCVHPSQHPLDVAAGELRDRPTPDPGMCPEAPRPDPLHRLLRGSRPAPRREHQAGVMPTATRTTPARSGTTSAGCSARSTSATTTWTSASTTAASSPTTRSSTT